MISEHDLIEYATKELKLLGFRKKNQRWTKTQGDFTLVFFVQGSQWDRETFYIRPGVWINDCPIKSLDYYGHFDTELQQDSISQVFHDLEEYYRKWTDKAEIKKNVIAFIDWDARNPLEKRRAGLVDYDTDPVPDRLLFAVSESVIEYVLDNF